MSMKIKKVDDKPMVIHTKKKMNIHKAEVDKTSRIKSSAKAEAVKDIKSKRKPTDNGAGAKGRWSLIKSVRDSKSSIKTKTNSLKVAGAAGLGTATSQVEGGKEVNEAAAIMVAASSPAIRGARVSSGAVRQAGLNLMKKKIKKVDAGKKIAKKSVKKATKNSIKKVAKGTAKKVAKEAAKETAKVTAKVTTQVATTAAGSAAGPYGMLIGAAAGAVVGEKIDVMDHKATMRMRKLKYFRDKMQAQENQTDSIGKLVKDIFLGNMKFVMKKVMVIIGAIIAALLPLIIIIGAIVGIVMAVIAFIYSTPLAWFLPPLDNGESVNNVASGYYSDFVTEYTEKADKHDKCQMGKIEFTGVDDNFKDIINIYMAKYGDGDTAADMSEKNKKNLKKVFDDMCSYTTSTGTEKVMENGKEVSKSCLYVKVTLKTSTDMVSEYNFTDKQKKWLEKLQNPSGL